MYNAPIVIDNGTGYTKLGYAGNKTPQFVLDSLVSTKMSKSVKGCDDLDFIVGSTKRLDYTTASPLKHGVIHDWDTIEKLWQACFFRYLNCDPENHHVLLTETPFNRPENRETMAEIMFESFNVPGLCISVQAVLALISSFFSQDQTYRDLTGIVVDSGDGLTHIIPVSEGYVIHNAIKSLPFAGKNITFWIQSVLREREAVSSETSFELAKWVKEHQAYTCMNPIDELEKYDRHPEKCIKRLNLQGGSIEIGHEQFLGPEILFRPELCAARQTTSLPVLLHSSIQECPIDLRKKLYGNIVLSGGSTTFEGFGPRLKNELKELVDKHLQNDVVNVKVVTPSHPHVAVWHGGSMLASSKAFPSMCCMRSEYQEHGPSICRSSKVLPTI